MMGAYQCLGLHLERLWAKLANNEDRSFLCGYPASAFKGTENEYVLNDICACHSEISASRNAVIWLPDSP